MTTNEQSPHGNHFAGSLPNQQVNHTPYQAPRYTQSTESFMAASSTGSKGASGNQKPQGVRPQTHPAQTSQQPNRNTARPQAANRPATRVAAQDQYIPNGQPPRKRGAGKKVGIVVAVILVALLAFGGTLGALLLKDAKSIMGQSQSMMAEVGTLKEALKNGDGDTLNATASSLAGQVGDIKNTIDSPAWTVASFIPVLGDDVSYARGLITNVDTLVQHGLVPACSGLANFQLSNLMQDGAINIDMLNTLVKTFKNVEPAVTTAAEGINELPEPHIGKLKELSAKISGPIDTAANMIPKVNKIAPLLPGMLGGDGPRHYLLMAQNNSELRSTGGLPGSVGTMTIDQGKLELGEFESGADITGKNSSPAARGVTPEEVALYSERVAGRITDTSINPDFPRVAHFASMLWCEQKGGSLDGVVMIDPIFLQYLLGLTGGFDAAGINVNGDNAARMLIHDAYNTMPVAMTDKFFSAAAAGAFNSVLGNLGNIGMTDLLGVIERSAKEGRFLVWMQDPDEESAMETLGFAGQIKTDETKPELGVFFSDETWSKISWYFSDNTVVDEGAKNPDGSTTYHVTTTIQNHLTPGEASKQVDYITGYHPNKRNITDMFMHLFLIPPAGGSISNVQTTVADFSPQAITTMPYNGIQITTGSYLLNGGDTATISYDVTTSPKATEPLAVRTTPTAQVVAGWDQAAPSEAPAQ